MDISDKSSHARNVDGSLQVSKYNETTSRVSSQWKEPQCPAPAAIGNLITTNFAVTTEQFACVNFCKVVRAEC